MVFFRFTGNQLGAKTLSQTVSGIIRQFSQKSTPPFHGKTIVIHKANTKKRNRFLKNLKSKNFSYRIPKKPGSIEK